ncbi:MAG: D-alanyl-D-alanine carboxypeptidase [Alphaproteobacteria bacterium]|nr:D-alanyl-D-alanine carboxypeptidase [Alphaproteobacteria bacterium]
MIKRLFLLFISLCLIGVSEKAEANDKYAAIIMDAHTGQIFYQSHASKRLHPASLTKMMTMLMVFNALDQKKLKPYSRIRISNHAASMIPSKLGLKPGTTIRVDDALQALATKSANDIAAAVAEKIGGTEEEFAKMMTHKAKIMGLRNTRFINASGLHDPRQISTARDMAKLAQIILTDYRHHYHYFTQEKFTYHGNTYHSHNKLMKSYPGMDGMKTGYIRQSGFNLVASAERYNRRLIGVVFGGKTASSRNDHMRELLDRAFNEVENIEIAKNAPIPQRKPITVDYGITSFAAVKTEPQYEETKVTTSRWAMLDSNNDKGLFNRMIGQGDYDIDVRNRIETGLIAVSAHQGENIPSYVLASADKNRNINIVKPTTFTEETSAETHEGDWKIQIGAFTTRDKTNRALALSMNQLPPEFKQAKTAIAPVKTNEGWIYRGRIHGYSKNAAYEACRILNDCIPIAPK